MGWEQVDEGSLAGLQIENEDVGASAAIKPLKVEKRKIFIHCHLAGAILNGSNVAESQNGVFPGITLPNANAGDFTLTTQSPRGEVSPGERPTVHIFWRSATNTNNVRFVVDIKPAIEGSSNLDSAIQKSIVSPAQGTANKMQQAKIEFPPSIFNNNQIIGLKISRDPSNELDDHSADVDIHAVYLEILGRC